MITDQNSKSLKTEDKTNITLVDSLFSSTKRPNICNYDRVADFSLLLKIWANISVVI